VVFADTNLVSETIKPQLNPRVAGWIRKIDTDLAISTVGLAEIAYGISRIRLDERAKRFKRFP
jgi:predicted nucleic acid-binding protein